MVGNAVWAEGNGSQSSPYTGNVSTGITLNNGSTVYLKDAKVDVSNDYALTLQNGTATLNVEGVCELRGSSEAFHSWTGTTLNITGTGILRIFSIKGEGNGNSGKSGDINVTGGTVYILGNVGHDQGNNSGTLNVQGGIAFVEGGIKGKQDNTNGILFQKSGETWNGTLYQDYTINSNIQADIDGDGEADDDDIILNLNSFDLSLGDGVVIDNRTANFEVDYSNGGTFTCFRVQYNANPVSAEDNVSAVPVNPSYYGTNADIRLEEGVTCNAVPSSGFGKHAFLGWVKEGDTEIHSANTGVIKTDASYNNQTGEQTVTILAAWALAERVVNVVENQAINPEIELANKPTGAVEYQSASGFPAGITFKNTEAKITGTVGADAASGGTDGVYVVNITYSFTKDGQPNQQGTAKIIFNVESDAANLNGGNVTIAASSTEDLIYNGTNQGNPITVTIDGTPYAGTLFKVTYEYTPKVENTTSYDSDGSTVIVKNAGTYKVTKLEANSSSVEGTLDNPVTISNQPLEIKVKPIELTFKVRNQSKDVDDNTTYNGATVSLSHDNSTTYNANGNVRLQTGSFVSGEVTSSSYDILTGTLSVSDESTLGTHDITVTGFGLKDANSFLKNNYTATCNNGTLTVTDALDDDDVNTEIKDEDGEDDNTPTEDENGAWTITYDGKTHEITKVKKSEVEIPATGANDEANYTISYTYKANADVEGDGEPLEEGGEVKNAGIYTATITFANGYEGTKTETIIIKPRDLTVDLNIPETIDPEQDLSDLSNWWTKDKIELTGIVADEADEAKAKLNNASVSITGPLTSGEAIDVVVNNIKLEDNDPFLTSNYTITYKNGETTISTFETKDQTGTNNDATLDDGTTVGQIEIDPSDDGDDITGGEDNTDPTDDDLADDEDFVMIVPEGEGSISVYDGESHGLSLLIIKKKDSDVTYTLKEGTDYSVSYKDEEGEDLGTDVEPKHAGSYTATVTLNDNSQYKIKDRENNSFELTIQIAQRPLEVYLNVPATIKEDQSLDDLSSWWNSSKITFNEGGFANDTEKEKAVETLSNAKASIEGTLTVGESVDVMLQDIELKDSDPFFTSNYTITYKKDNTTVEGITLSDKDEDGSNDDTTIDDGTTVDDSDKIEIDPDDEDTDITGGENEDGEEGLDEDDYILVSTGNSDDINAIYDGETHTIEYMVATVNGTTYYLTAGTDFTVGFNNSEEGLEEGKPHDAGTYKATIEMTGKYKGNFTLDVTIKPRPLTVYFNFPQEIADKANIEWNKNHITYNGLVNADEEDEETPMIPNGCRLEVRNNKVWLMNFALNDNVDTEFEKDNYVISYQGNTGDITVLINSADDDIDNDGTPDTELPDGEIDLNPGDHDKPDGGNHGSGWDKPEYYNIYQDTICPGIHIELSKNVVQEGHQVSVYLTIQSECDTTGMRFEYKRGLFGWWEDLKPLESAQPGEYVIKNIYTDIYIRALDATMPDATGLEEVEGVKAYAQDGNIYVYTPNRMPVWIVSMTGAVLRNEEQVGLQAYDRLTRGIYIVRVGEQVFKIRL